MNILLYADSDRMLGLAHRLVAEGHSVQVYSQTAIFPRTGDGLWNTAVNAKDAIKACQFIVVEKTMPQDQFNYAKLFNKPVVGWHPLADLLNASSVKEFEAAINCGCSYPYTQIFDDASDLGELIVGWNQDRYYIKHGRRTINCEHSQWLSWAMFNLPFGEPVLVQEETVGIEASVIGWFDGFGWCDPFVISNSDSGKLGASILWRDQDKSLAMFTLEPLGNFLKIINYHGPVKCNLTISEEGTFLIRVYIGLTFPDLYAFIEGLKEPIGDFLWSIAIGRQRDIKFTHHYSVAFEANVHEADMDGAPLTGVDDANLRHIALHNVYKSDGNYYLASGFSRSYTAMARGEAVEIATGRAYRTIQLLTFPCMGYPSNMRFHFSILVDRVRKALEAQGL